jgi:uncharacterized protein (TIGR03067 family)
MHRKAPTATALAMLLLVPAALLGAADAPKGDKDLDGDWEIASVVRDGKEQTLDEKPVVTIKGDSLSFKRGDEAHKGTIKADAGQTPKTIDLTPDDGPDKGKTLMGVYELKGDELRLCHGEPGSDRPKELSSKEGSGLTLVTLKRVKK